MPSLSLGHWCLKKEYFQSTPMFLVFGLAMERPRQAVSRVPICKSSTRLRELGRWFVTTNTRTVTP